MKIVSNQSVSISNQEQFRVLIISYKSYENNSYAGGGWVKSFGDLLASRPEFTIAICYITNEKDATFWMNNNISYFPIYHRYSTLKKIFNKLSNKSDIIFEDQQIQRIIDQFQPTIIQLFGLETKIGGIVRKINDTPIIVHIQGLATPCRSAWFPKGYSKRECKIHSRLTDRLLHRTTVDLYREFSHLANNEYQYAKHYRYYFGRTDWDKEWARRLSPRSTYFHCDELLRPEFYDANWQYHQGKLVLTSISNGELYKGFDSILKIAEKLKSSGLEFDWKVIGVDNNFPLKRIFEKHEGISFASCNVNFIGKQSAREIVSTLQTTSFYLHLSHIDNSPNALCEAMLIGVPCIATKVGGIPSLISDRENGFLSQDYDTDGICQIILSNYNKQEKLNSISIAAKRTASDRHSHNAIINSVISSYRHILSKY